MKDTCPKCQAPHVEGTEYCVCGHKWNEPKTDSDIFEFLRGLRDEPKATNNNR